MSEPLSAVEIEDVLSSIRRLVSEDLRPAMRTPSAAAPEKAKAALLLTPALRVVPDAAPPAEAAKPVVPIQDVVASVGAAVPSEGQDWEPETGDATLADPPIWADPVWDDTTWHDAAPVSAPVTDPAIDDEPLVTVEPEPVSDWAEVDVDVEVDVVPEMPATEEAVAVDPSPVSEGAPADDEWLDRAEAEVIAGLEQGQTEPPPFAPSYGEHFDTSQDASELSFDEEVLRDLVRDLIREELQGHLGERITRNIRKLVRAEIARAMTVQDLT